MKKNVVISLLALALQAPPCVFAGGPDPFAVPAGLADEVRFWKLIFGTYDTHQIVLHDARHLGVIYGVLDFGGMNAKKQGSRAARIAQRTQEIRAALLRLAAGVPASQWGEEERYLHSLFATVTEPDKYTAAVGRIRAQGGQRSRLRRAVVESYLWMGDIEPIFDRVGVPRELTTLILIESMSNPQAMSEVGARGLWQFMPETGKDYVAMNHFFDERADPLHSSEGAARFLKDLYQRAGDWALAINAYHSGLGRIQRAVKQLGTREIATIVHRFDDPAYSFYSRNYYPEFLAVLDLARERGKNLGLWIKEAPLMQYDIVTTADFVLLPDVMQRFAVEPAQLKRFNPALTEEVLRGDLPLPPNYPLKVPKGLGYHLANVIGYAGRR